jgi:hypothetical protein
MKKSILIIVILSIAALCFAGPLQEMHKRVIAGSSSGGGEVSACESASETIIVGDDTQSGDAAISNNQIYCSAPYTASDDCPVSTLRMSFSDIDPATNNARLAIYETSAGTPTGAPIRSSDAQTVDSTTETFAIAEWTPTQGESYHICVCMSGTGNRGYMSDGGSAETHYMGWTYHATNDFPTYASDGTLDRNWTAWGRVD